MTDYRFILKIIKNSIWISNDPIVLNRWKFIILAVCNYKNPTYYAVMKIYVYMTVNLSIYYLQKLFIFFIYAWQDADVWLKKLTTNDVITFSRWIYTEPPRILTQYSRNDWLVFIEHKLLILMNRLSVMKQV